MCQRLPPGMQDGEEADLRTKATWIGGQRRHGFGRRREKNGVDPRLVLEGDRGDGRGHGEYDMEVWNRQQFGLPVHQPLRARRALTFWTVPVATGVVGDADDAAIVAGLDVAAQSRSAAGDDGAYDLLFDAADMADVRQPVSVAVAAKDIRDFQTNATRLSVKSARLLAHHWVSTRRGDLQGQAVEGALRRSDHISRDAGIERGRHQAVVAKQDLDDTDVGSGLQQMGRETVAQGVQRHPFGEASFLDSRTASGVQGGRMDRAIRVAPGKQKRLWPGEPPISAQDAEQLR